jgi:hypothetical protein
MEKQRKEKRRHRRRNVAVCAWLAFNGDGASRGMVSVDLAPEGARFCALNPVSAGQPVLVRLQLGPSRRAIECKGRVCWTRSMPDSLRHFGVRFLDLHEEEEIWIREFLGGSATHPTAAAC